ncbi:MAG: hypothetical protein ACMUIL_00880 [bacterium]
MSKERVQLHLFQICSKMEKLGSGLYIEGEKDRFVFPNALGDVAP